MKGLLYALMLWFSIAHAAPLPATGSVDALFSPWDDVEGTVIHHINDAGHSIYVQAYVLTSRPIARALMVAKGRGVNVQVLADADMDEKNESSQLGKLLATGIPVWLETRYGAAHNKVILIDVEYGKGTVITGSYNFSWAAQARNAENLLVLKGNSALGQRYLDNWKRHRAEARVMQAKAEGLKRAN